jgi:nucleoside-diphosphate-sugar epimerase
MNRISIIGLGWLGKQIGNYFQNKGFTVSGTATTKEKVEKLLKESFNAEQLKIEKLEAINAQNFSPFLARTVVITIPPLSVNEGYDTLIIDLINRIKAVNPKVKVFFTSSTSVYGNKDEEIDEYSEVNPITKNAKEIVAIENFMQSELSNFCIFRLGGLVGRNRHPVHYLAGREDILKPKAAVNLIHASDVCNALHFIVENEVSSKIVNLVTPDHPSKEIYYTTVAENLSLSLPKFDQSDTRLDKVVKPLELMELGFNFKYTSPYDYPEADKPTE